MFIYTAALALLPFSLAAPLVAHLAPIRRTADVGGRSANGSYIVSIKSNTVKPKNRGRWLNKVLSTNSVTLDDDTTQSLKLKWSPDVFNGIAGTFSTDALDALRAQPEVAWIEEDVEMYITAQQDNAPWGLARLSSGASFVGKNPNSLNFKYKFEDAPGAGTEAFVIDTGCRVEHRDFEGRAKFVATFGRGTPNKDLNGHGTHVAGTIGGRVFGVAKKTNLNCIKVMSDDGGGSASDIISGINLARDLALASGKPSVISMSLGGPVSRAMDDAVTNVVRQGIPFVVAAGNESAPADRFSPARVPAAITVGASTISDSLAEFSNFGPAVDILAPGQDILSAGSKANDAVESLSGTSMAAPHISGLALYIMGREGKLSPNDLLNRLKTLAVSNIGGGARFDTTTAIAGNGIQS